jgi:hypothetical protein
MSKRGVCLEWGGTNVDGRNETNMGVMVLNVPHRHDVAPNSCVNYEVIVFNRKPGRQTKVHKKLSVITVDIDMDYIQGMGFA